MMLCIKTRRPLCWPYSVIRRAVVWLLATVKKPVKSNTEAESIDASV